MPDVFARDDFTVEPLLNTMTERLTTLLREKHIDNPLMIGIHTGGAWVAEELHRRLQLSSPLGALNIAFYRDDFERIGMHPQVQPSRLPVAVDNRTIILVDDVLYTGRTIRAALNEIFDYGRPSSVIFAALIDRGGRELPIQADVVGATVSLQASEQVKVTGPSPLKISVVKK